MADIANFMPCLTSVTTYVPGEFDQLPEYWVPPPQPAQDSQVTSAPKQTLSQPKNVGSRPPFAGKYPERLLDGIVVPDLEDPSSSSSGAPATPATPGVQMSFGSLLPTIANSPVEEPAEIEGDVDENPDLDMGEAALDDEPAPVANSGLDYPRNPFPRLLNPDDVAELFAQARDTDNEELRIARLKLTTAHVNGILKELQAEWAGHTKLLSSHDEAIKRRVTDEKQNERDRTGIYKEPHIEKQKDDAEKAARILQEKKELQYKKDQDKLYAAIAGFEYDPHPSKVGKQDPTTQRSIHDRSNPDRSLRNRRQTAKAIESKGSNGNINSSNNANNANNNISNNVNHNIINNNIITNNIITNNNINSINNNSVLIESGPGKRVRRPPQQFDQTVARTEARKARSPTPSPSRPKKRGRGADNDQEPSPAAKAKADNSNNRNDADAEEPSRKKRRVSNQLPKASPPPTPTPLPIPQPVAAPKRRGRPPAAAKLAAAALAADKTDAKKIDTKMDTKKSDTKNVILKKTDTTKNTDTRNDDTKIADTKITGTARAAPSRQQTSAPKPPKSKSIPPVPEQPKTTHKKSTPSTSTRLASTQPTASRPLSCMVTLKYTPGSIPVAAEVVSEKNYSEMTKSEKMSHSMKNRWKDGKMDDAVVKRKATLARKKAAQQAAEAEQAARAANGTIASTATAAADAKSAEIVVE